MRLGVVGGTGFVVWAQQQHVCGTKRLRCLFNCSSFSPFAVNGAASISRPSLRNQPALDVYVRRCPG